MAVWPRVSGVVLAAGAGTRLGRPKALLDWRGEPLVRRQARTALASGLAQVVVVAGAAAEEVAAAVSDLDVEVVVHPGWSAGLASSLAAGLRRVASDVEAALFLPVDQPLVDAALLDRLIGTYAETRAPIVVPACRGRWGSPRLFSRGLFGELLGLEGDAGGRQLIADHRGEIAEVELDDDLALQDVDTPEELARLSLLRGVDNG